MLQVDDLLPKRRLYWFFQVISLKEALKRLAEEAGSATVVGSLCLQLSEELGTMPLGDVDKAVFAFAARCEQQIEGSSRDSNTVYQWTCWYLKTILTFPLFPTQDILPSVEGWHKALAVLALIRTPKPDPAPDPITEATKRAEQRYIAHYHLLYQQVQAASSITELDDIALRLAEQIRRRKIRGTLRALLRLYEGRLTELCTEIIYTLVISSPTLRAEQGLIVLESKNHHSAIGRLRQLVERHLDVLQAEAPDEPVFATMVLVYQRYQRRVLWWDVVNRLGWEQAHPEGDQEKQDEGVDGEVGVS